MSYIGNQPTNTAFVTDQFSGTGSQTAFTMSLAPATTSSILVSITGVLQDPSTYSISGTTLTFSAAPPSGTGNISVRYLGIPASGVTTTAYRTVTEFTATAGQTSFGVPSYTVGYIDVYRNGSKLGSADFTATNGTTVVLASGCSAGDLVQTVSFYVSSVLNAIPATAGAVNSTYITDAAVTTAKIANANVTQAKLAAGVAGNGPAFSAYLTAQSFSSGTWTKCQFSTKNFDTANCYDATTNYRFTPNTAGYYQVNVQISMSAGITSAVNAIAIRKNGTEYASVFSPQVGGQYTSATVTQPVYLNGSTDYIEGYFFQNSGLTLGVVNVVSTNLISASLVRAA